MNACEGVQGRMQQEYGLRVLRIYMDNTSTEKPLAVFTLVLSDGSQVALLTASMPELGFRESRPAQAGGNPLPDTYRLPVHVTEALVAWLNEDKGAGQPLWLQLSVPLGLLAAVPWEELLQPRLGVPVLRLPFQALTPRIPEGDIDTLLCISSPAEEPGLHERLERFVQEVPLDLAQTTHFHLFGNRLIYPHLVELQRRYGNMVRIDVYDPAQAVSSHSVAGNPWLAWMEAKMGEGGADVVHFLCHGAYEFDEGSLVLAADPVETPGLPACMLGRADLIAFLDQLGAWCVAFTSAPAERSAAGMRLLQTAVAQQRPGPALVHDMNVAGSRDGLQTAYRFLFSQSITAPASPAVALYCHPVLLRASMDDPVSNDQLAHYTLDSRLGSMVNDSAPAWLASSQRKLEATAATLASAVKDGAVGRARAREFVLDALASQAMNRGPGTTTEEE